MEKIYFMEREDPEFNRAFGALDDKAAWNEQYAEGWQYMGTIRVENQWIHEFRHRWHPKTNKREYFRVAARFGWEPRTLTDSQTGMRAAKSILSTI